METLRAWLTERYMGTNYVERVAGESTGGIRGHHADKVWIDEAPASPAQRQATAFICDHCQTPWCDCQHGGNRDRRK